MAAAGSSASQGFALEWNHSIHTRTLSVQFLCNIITAFQVTFQFNFLSTQVQFRESAQFCNFIRNTYITQPHNTYFAWLVLHIYCNLQILPRLWFRLWLAMEDLNWDTMSPVVEKNTVLGWWQACPVTELVWNHRTPLYSSNSVPLLSDTGANQFALHH